MLISKPRFIYPPRPNSVVTLDELPHYGSLGFVGQFKFNDSRTTISYLPDGTYELWNRDGSRPQFYPTAELDAEIKQVRSILGLKEDSWSYLDAGLLHKKHRAIKNTLVIWDILVRDNDYLTGTTYISRFNSIIDKAVEPYAYNDFLLGYRLTDNILVPKNFKHDEWGQCWQDVTEINKSVGFTDENSPVGPLLEGLVLKDPHGTLSFASREANNTDWSVRCRVKTGRHQI